MTKYLDFLLHSYSTLRLGLLIGLLSVLLLGILKAIAVWRQQDPVPVILFEESELESEEIIVLSQDGTMLGAEQNTSLAARKRRCLTAAAFMAAFLIAALFHTVRTVRVLSTWREAESRFSAREYDACWRINLQAIALDKSCRWSHYLAAKTCLAQKNIERATSELQLAVASSYGDAVPWIELGGCLTRMNRLDEAERAFRTACSIGGAMARPHVLLAQCVAARGHVSEALSILEYAVKLEPGSSQAHASMGMLLMAAGDVDKAEEHLQRATALAPRDVAAHNFLGAAYASKKDYPHAIMEFRTEIALEPQFSIGYFNLASTLEKVGDKAGALGAYEAYLRRCTLKPDGSLAAAPAAIDAVRRLKGLPQVTQSTAARPRHDALIMKHTL